MPILSVLLLICAPDKLMAFEAFSFDEALSNFLDSTLLFLSATVFMTYRGRKLQNLLQRLAKRNAKKAVSINYKKTECMVTRKVKCPVCEL